jgi:hypothetical protein
VLHGRLGAHAHHIPHLAPRRGGPGAGDALLGTSDAAARGSGGGVKLCLRLRGFDASLTAKVWNRRAFDAAGGDGHRAPVAARARP